MKSRLIKWSVVCTLILLIAVSTFMTVKRSRNEDPIMENHITRIKNCKMYETENYYEMIDIYRVYHIRKEDDVNIFLEMLRRADRVNEDIMIETTDKVIDLECDSIYFISPFILFESDPEVLFKLEQEDVDAISGFMMKFRENSSPSFNQ